MDTKDSHIDNRQTLIDLAKTSNEQLEGASQASAYRAFNLGCMLGILPALLVGLIAFLTAQYSWIAGVTAALIMLIAAAGFAGLAAYLTRARRMERIFHEQVYPELSQKLANMQIDMPTFLEISVEELPSNAALVHMLSQEGQNSLNHDVSP
jgi:hypothetical protein